MDINLHSYLERFSFNPSLFEEQNSQAKTKIDSISINEKEYHRFTNEYWTSQQRQSNSIHEISYRACFKAQLPRFFIEIFTKRGETVYDPFSGRGTTAIESAILGRNIIANDINPLSAIFILPRLNIPNIKDVATRLSEIPITGSKDEFDLSMFFHEKTQQEITSLRNYLKGRKESNEEDEADSWIRMVATNRLTGHSSGFFSVYTLPPNQAVSREGQTRINKVRKQTPAYRDTKEIILRKTRTLLADMTPKLQAELRKIATKAKVITEDAQNTHLKNSSVDLTVTSPPFLDTVDYVGDNWLRCWFNSLDLEEITSRITIHKGVDAWANFILGVFRELFRITKISGWVAFEVGEVRNGKVRLDEIVIPLGESVGFKCHGVVVNLQSFTKTANIWGVSNNKRGTNTNRIILFEKV
jgi:DNA modification methylase